MKYFTIYFCLLICIIPNTHAEGLGNITGALLKSDTVTVDAKTNIYSAGETVPFAPAGGGAGILPIVIEFEPREQDQEQVLIFPSITGEISCTTPSLYNDADGGTFCLGHTMINDFNKFSGIKINKTMFLAAVFTTNDKTQTSIPFTRDFSQPSSFDFDGTGPLLNQIFFIGDGHNSKGNMQYFHIPAQASRLYLGFIDGDETGKIGFYEDNLGELFVNYEIRNSASYQAKIEPQPPIISNGLILHYTFDNRHYINTETGDFQNGNLKDDSGFGLHGIISQSGDSKTSVSFSYQHGKYDQGIKIPDISKKIQIINPSPEIRGLPINGDWSISTWFNYNATHPYFSIERQSCSGFGCPAGFYVATNSNNNYELSTSYVGDNYFTEYAGSGFYMTELEEGWHHLAATATQGKTNFYINGKWVGQAPAHVTGHIEYIHAWMLDDFRVYNRALSHAEISALAEKSTVPSVNFLSNNCIASYSSDGKLHIPCLLLPEIYDNTQLYDIELNQYANDFIFEVDMNSIKLSEF